MHDKSLFIPKLILYTLVGFFILLASYIIFPIPISIRRAIFPFIAILGILSSLLGIALILVTLKLNIKGKVKKYLVLTGITATGIPISAILHNLVYGLFIYFFGKNFWGRIGLNDEPVFFFLAIIVFPILFIIGISGCILIFIKDRGPI